MVDSSLTNNWRSLFLIKFIIRDLKKMFFCSSIYCFSFFYKYVKDLNEVLITQYFSKYSVVVINLIIPINFCGKD
jgi:hypothetical protein